MNQLHLFYPNKVDVNGRIDLDGRVTFLGEAQYSHGDGIYKCLARVDNALCVVEARITPLETSP